MDGDKENKKFRLYLSGSIFIHPKKYNIPQIHIKNFVILYNLFLMDFFSSNIKKRFS
jgi:hypothetical protein